MKHPDKIRSHIKKLKQSLPELRHTLKQSDFKRELHVSRLHSALAKIEALEWVLEEGEE